MPRPAARRPTCSPPRPRRHRPERTPTIPSMLLHIAARTDVTLRAERFVRDPTQFKWYAVALLALVVYVYANEVERGRWDVVAAGLALWLSLIHISEPTRRTPISYA